MKKTNCPNLAKNLIILLILSLIFAILFSSSIYALSSDNINLQGKIVRNDTGHEGMNVIPGSPACVVNGPSNDTCDFRVSYYTALTGGTLLLTEDFTNVEIGQFDGVFELSLGSGTVTTTLQCRDGTCNSPSEVISEYGDLYVELQFAPDGSTLTETFTRMPLEASPYAIFSKFAEGAHDAFKLSTSVSNESLENPSAGMIYFDTGSSQLKVYNGAEWQGLSAGTSSSLWTDAGTYSYLTSTTDDLVLGGSTFNTGRFVFDMDGGSGSYFDVFNNDHSNKLFTILSNGNVGIGTATPGAKLEVGGTASTISNNSGDITIDPVSNLVVTSRVYQTGLGGSTYFGENAGRVDDLSSNYNTGIGYNSLYLNTSGSSNTALGSYSLRTNSTGSYNIALGYSSLYSNTSGNYNTALGYNSLSSNTTGHSNTALGFYSLYSNTTGSFNTALGYFAGMYQADGSTALTDPEYSVYIGYNARGKDNNDNNSIVIGYNAVGLGANTVVLGNDSIVTTALKGKVGIGTTTPRVLLDVSGTRSNTISYSTAIAGIGGADVRLQIGALNGSPNYGVWIQSERNYEDTVFPLSLNPLGGNVGIGKANPQYPLEVNGTIRIAPTTYTNSLLVGGYVGASSTSQIDFYVPGLGDMILQTNYSSGDIAFNVGSTGQAMRIKAENGYVGIGVADPTYRLQLPNTANNAGKGQANAWVTYSDISLKENIQTISGGLDKIMALRGVTFDWKGQGVASSGFIAQEVEPIIPDLVSTDSNGLKSLDYGRFTPYLVEAIKEQQLQIQTAYSRIEQLENINENKIIRITTPGWYRISKLDTNDDHSNIKINNTSVGSSQNLVLSIDSTLNNQNINIVSNLTTGEYDITKARIHNENGIKYLEIYIPEVNENKISVKITESSNWIATDIVQITEEVNNAQEYALSGILFGISDKLEVEEDNVKIAGNLLSLSVNSSIGDSANRWNDIYAKGTIRLGSGADGEGAIRFNVQTKTLEFSNNGVEWLSVGDLSSQMTISPEYAGAILFADGSDNSGIMTSDAVEEGGSFKNYYEWVSNKDTPQDYDILVRITLPADFLSWKEDAIYLDFMTENSVNTDNNSVGLSLIGNSGTDVQISGGISKIAGAWERMSIKGADITQCNSAGGTCTLRISLTSSMEYFTRVGDITLNYNRSL